MGQGDLTQPASMKFDLLIITEQAGKQILQRISECLVSEFSISQKNDVRFLNCLGSRATEPNLLHGHIEFEMRGVARSMSIMSQTERVELVRRIEAYSDLEDTEE